MMIKPEAYGGSRIHGRKRSATGGHQPGHGYKQNFNRTPKGRMGIRMHRGKASRSHSRGG
jgi:hypothetical protein